MKKIIPVLLALCLVSWFWESDDKKETAKDTVIEKQWFKNDNTFVIICRGWPKEGLTGRAKLDSAKEAALINAQFSSRDLFDKSVDVVKSGNIEQYKVYDDYVTVEYSITKNGLRKYYKGKKK
jgi:hypothetical protein